MSQQQPQQATAVRVNKYLSEAGFCSRREADKLVDSGLVTINDRPVEMGTKVMPGDKVRVRGKLIDSKPERIYIALNKPRGITCTTERSVEGNIVDYINYPQRIFPIGRLDKPSEGLILLTNDGDIVNKILRAGNNHEKEYMVTVDKPISEDFIRNMAAGVPILDTVTNPCKVRQTSKFGFEIILTQGLNRQIRRMCEYLGYRVRKLKRMRIMNLTVDNLSTGSWRHLSQHEMDNLNQLIAGSSKTAPGYTPGQNRETRRDKQAPGRHGHQPAEQRADGRALSKSRRGKREIPGKEGQLSRKPVSRGKSTPGKGKYLYVANNHQQK